MAVDMAAAFAWCLLCLLCLAAGNSTHTNSTADALCSQCQASIDLDCLAALYGGPQLGRLPDLLAIRSCFGDLPGTLRMLITVPEAEFQIGGALQALHEVSGWQVDVETKSSAAFAADLRNNISAISDYDIWVVDPAWTVELMATGLVQPLSNFTNQVGDLDWKDLYRVYRNTSSHYNGSLVSIPLAGEVGSLYVRPDTLNGTTAPATWDELLAVARRINGTDIDQDGQPEYALCLPLDGQCGEGGALLSQILASMTQYQGTISGWLFAPEDMQPLVDNQAMYKALALLSELRRYSFPGSFNATDGNSSLFPTSTGPSCGAERVSNSFLAGRCAITLGGFEVFKRLQLASSQAADASAGNQTSSSVWPGVSQPGWYTTAALPGSHWVLDRPTGALVECLSSEVCRYSVPLRLTETRRVTLVNRAPLTPASGLAGFINRQQGTKRSKQAAFNLLSILSTADNSMQRVWGPGALGPYRTDHLSVEAASSYGSWGAAVESNTTQLQALLRPLNSSLASGNVALWVRMANQDLVRAALQHAATMQLGGSPTNQTIPTLLASLLNLTGSPADNQTLFGYQAGLQYLPLIAPGDGVRAPAADNSIDSHTLLSGLIVVSVVVGTGIMFGGLVLLYRTERRKLWGIGVGAPKAGPQATILVTDIENSTLLWESISQDVMNQSVELHHDLVRSLLRTHGGYESATEGDSFIAAFQTPGSALAFAATFQLELQLQDWPAELLESPLAGCLWAKSSSTSTTCAQGLGMHTAAQPAPFARASLSVQAVSFVRTSLSMPGGQTSSLEQRTLTAAPAWSSLCRMIKVGFVSGQKLQPSPNASAGRLVSNEIGTEFEDDSHTPSAPVPASALAGKFQKPSFSPYDKESRWMDSPFPAGASDDGTSNFTSPSMMHLAAAPMSPSAPGHFRRSVSDGVAMTAPARPKTVLEFMKAQWRECAPPNGNKKRTCKLVFRGLRVRVGMHTGIEDPEDAILNKTTGRVSYSGLPLALAKAVADAGHGGMVLLTQNTFEELPTGLLRSFGMLINMGDYSFMKNVSLPATSVYQLVCEGLEQRLPFLAPRMRDVIMIQNGVLSAPVGEVAISFVNMVGVGTLMAWNREVMQEAIHKYQVLAIELLQGTFYGQPTESAEQAGYLVEAANGLLLAAFTSPAHAILWGLHLIQRLKTADWPEELLAHELCEQVAVATHGGGGSNNGTTNVRTSCIISTATYHHSTSNLAGSIADTLSDAVPSGQQYERRNSMSIAPTGQQYERRNSIGSAPIGNATIGNAPIGQQCDRRNSIGMRFAQPATKTQVQVLFRGPRLKIGVDVGVVHANANPVTGRMAFRGRVMNRSSRIAEKAGSGQLFCSEAAWTSALQTEIDLGAVEATLLGGFNLKGVSDTLQLVQCSMDEAETVVPATRSSNQSGVTWEDASMRAGVHFNRRASNHAGLGRPSYKGASGPASLLAPRSERSTSRASQRNTPTLLMTLDGIVSANGADADLQASPPSIGVVSSPKLFMEEEEEEEEEEVEKALRMIRPPMSSALSRSATSLQQRLQPSRSVSSRSLYANTGLPAPPATATTIPSARSWFMPGPSSAQSEPAGKQRKLPARRHSLYVHQANVHDNPTFNRLLTVSSKTRTFSSMTPPPPAEEDDEENDAAGEESGTLSWGGLCLPVPGGASRVSRQNSDAAFTTDLDMAVQRR